MPGTEEIYTFLKNNGLTNKDPQTFAKEYADPKKAEELHKFFLDNQLTTKDSASFYDTYFKKKDGTTASQNSGGGLSPLPSKSSLNGGSFYEAIGGNPISTDPNKPALKPRAKTLEEAHQEDKNWSGNLWNKFLQSGENMITGATDAVFSTMNRWLPESVVGATPEEATKIYREQVIPNIIEGKLVKAVGANVTPQEQANFEAGTVSGALGGLAGSAIPMLMPKGTKVAAMFMQAYDSGLKSINASEEGKNLPESTKTIFGVATGAMNAALEKVGLDKIFGKQSTAVATKLASKTIADLVKKSTVPITAEMVDQAVTAAAKTLKERVVKAGGKIAGAGLVEFATGASQEAGMILAEAITNKATGKKVFEESSFGDKMLRMGKAGVMEGIGGFVVGGAALPFSKTRNYIAEKVSEAKSPADIENLKKELIDFNPLS